MHGEKVKNHQQNREAVEEVMVIKIIIGIMISSQISDFGHLWHAHPQR